MFLPLIFAVLVAMFKSEANFDIAYGILSNPVVKIIAIGLIWAIMHHSIAGIRYILIDVHYKVSKEGAHQTALVVMVVSLILTAVFAVKMFL